MPRSGVEWSLGALTEPRPRPWSFCPILSPQSPCQHHFWSSRRWHSSGLHLTGFGKIDPETSIFFEFNVFQLIGFFFNVGWVCGAPSLQMAQPPQHWNPRAQEAPAGGNLHLKQDVIVLHDGYSWKISICPDSKEPWTCENKVGGPRKLEEWNLNIHVLSLALQNHSNWKSGNWIYICLWLALRSHSDWKSGAWVYMCLWIALRNHSNW